MPVLSAGQARFGFPGVPPEQPVLQREPEDALPCVGETVLELLLETSDLLPGVLETALETAPLLLACIEAITKGAERIFVLCPHPCLPLPAACIPCIPTREPVVARRYVSGNLPLVKTYQIEGLAALGDPTRRAIFEHLADRPRAVGELARELPVSRPAVSQHLKVLKDARLVIDRPAGNRRIYEVDLEGIGALRAYLDQFWNRALTAYKSVVEQQAEEVP